MIGINLKHLEALKELLNKINEKEKIAGLVMNTGKKKKKLFQKY